MMMVMIIKLIMFPSQVQETAGRDCKPGQLAEMIATLKAWVQASESISNELSDKIKFAEQSQVHLFTITSIPEISLFVIS